MNKKKIALLCTGYGRGIINLILNKHEIVHKITLVICPRSSKKLIKIASENQINIQYLDTNKSLSQKNEIVLDFLITYKIDYLFLVGCMFIIKGDLLKAYRKKIINIHPSLLPSFKGIDAIRQAIDYGVKISGLTTHYINEELDSGEIIKQKEIVIEGLTFEEIDAKFVKEGINISISTINLL